MVGFLKKNPMHFYMQDSERSYKKITKEHLVNLKDASMNDQELFFNKNSRYTCFNNRLYAILLVQGAALHYIDNINGIKDFDVLMLYKENNSIKDITGKIIKIPYRRRGQRDCGMPEFGRWPDDPATFKNRRVDILMREIDLVLIDSNDVFNSIKKYFWQGNTKSIKLWRKKAIVGICPDELLGKIIWP